MFRVRPRPAPKPKPAPVPKARPADPPAWELAILVKDRATDTTRGETIGCLAHTKSEARAKLRQLINERYKAHLVRLPAGLSPVRAEQPTNLRVHIGKAMAASGVTDEDLAVKALKAGTRFRRR
jgi:hypothetical protein